MRRALFRAKWLRYVDLVFFPASTIMSFTRWCIFSCSALVEVWYHRLKVFVLGKKRRLQERSKFPQFLFSHPNVRTGYMYSGPWFLHTHGHKCDNQTIKGYFCRWKRPCAYLNWSWYTAQKVSFISLNRYYRALIRNHNVYHTMIFCLRQHLLRYL